MRAQSHACRARALLTRFSRRFMQVNERCAAGNHGRSMNDDPGGGKEGLPHMGLVGWAGARGAICAAEGAAFLAELWQGMMVG